VTITKSSAHSVGSSEHNTCVACAGQCMCMCKREIKHYFHKITLANVGMRLQTRNTTIRCHTQTEQEQERFRHEITTSASAREHTFVSPDMAQQRIGLATSRAPTTLTSKSPLMLQ
jgi:hypothetical protein